MNLILEQLIPYFENVWSVMLELSFWLLIGMGIAGVLHVWVPDNFVKHHLGNRKGLSTVFKAVIFGVPMPLCSCGVIPAALGIKKQGAGNGSAIGFLISTPQTGVDSIMVSASMLGLPFALFKLFSAFVIGLMGGIWVYLTDSSSAASEEEDTNTHETKRGLRDLFIFAIDDLLKMIWKWLIAGVFISAAITTWMPKDFFQTYLPNSLPVAMVVVLLVSLPMYVCATASVPIAAALVHTGMPTGAALVFLMAGPASNIATIGAVYRAFGGKKLAIYLSSIIIGSMICGMLFHSVIPISSGTQMSVSHHDAHSIIEWVSAILLILLMLRFLLLDIKAWFSTENPDSDTPNEQLSISVGGIICQGCADKVTKALMEIEGISKVDIDIDAALVTVSGVNLEENTLKAKIVTAGFSISSLNGKVMI